jgi:hypothetical protein
MKTRNTLRTSTLTLIGTAVSLAFFGTSTSTAGYRWAYHPGYGYTRVGVYGGYGAYGGATTAAQGAGVGVGAAEAGYGQAAAGVGQYQIEHAQAERIHQQAVTQYYQNENLARENYEQRQQAQQQQLEADEAADRQRVAAYHEHLQQLTAPHRLTADQFDRANNIIQWPYVLRGAEYSDLRLTLDKLYAERTPDNSGENSSNYEEIEKACNAMLDIVNSHVKELGIEEFITAKHFTQSLAYEARFKMTGGAASGSSSSN